MRTRVISIAGAKGSPGCSFLAGSLARCLGDAGIAALLVDADEEDGGLAAQLDLKHAEDRTVDVSKHLQFMEISARRAGTPEAQLLAQRLRDAHGAVVIDLGHRAGPLQRQLADASDWLIWVVVPDRSGLERADRAMGSRSLVAAAEGLVLNRIRRGALADADKVLSDRHGVPVMARIKESARAAERVASGRPAHRLRSIRRPIAQLARCVHPDASPVRPGWP